MGWPGLLGTLAGLAAAGVCVVLLGAWSGIYNVAASRGHWPLVELLLRFGMENSVEAHAPDITPPRLDDPDLVRLGAAHFQTGCAYCHGAPGSPMSAIARHMLPPPPELTDRVDPWSDQELFWIVKHGFKYTGMPAWTTQVRDDEVWALVAFLRQLPRLDPLTYRELALGDVMTERQDGRSIATTTSGADEACARCHGAEGKGPLSDLVPRLHGQPAAMLERALRAYASGERPSGIMQPIAAALSPRAKQQVAGYYAGLAVPPSRIQAEASEAGRQLAMDGDAAAEIPACLSCHDAQALAIYPRLAGQNASYMANQLRALQRGSGEGSATRAIMAPIARRLSERQIVELSAWFASLPATP